MEEIKSVCCIGCGGIMSWFAEHLRHMIDIYNYELHVVFYDNDEVEEKNILRHTQNFSCDDLMEQKAEVIANKFNFNKEIKFIEDDNINDLKRFDYVIMGVDNHKTRKLVYNFCIDNNIYLLDLRAQGTQVFYNVIDEITDKEKSKEYYNNKFFNNEQVMQHKGSCQLTRDVENDHIENGNKLIAFMGAYNIFLKKLRGDKLLCNEFRFVY